MKENLGSQACLWKGDVLEVWKKLSWTFWAVLFLPFPSFSGASFLQIRYALKGVFLLCRLLQADDGEHSF